MKIIFNKEAMIREISIAQKVIANKSPLSILSNVLLEAKDNRLVIRATDSTVKFVTKIPVEIENEGIITIFCDKFMSILSSLPSGDVELSQDENGVVIKPNAKKVKFKMKMLASDKFPEFISNKDCRQFEIACKDLKNMIQNTIFAVSTEKNRYFMTGVFLVADGVNITAVATDGRRMSIMTKSSTENFPGVIIPTKVLNILTELLGTEGNVVVKINDKSISFFCNNFELYSNLIDGQYPSYARVIPVGLDSNFVIPKKDLEEAMKRSKIMSNSTGRLSFYIGGNSLKITTPDTEIGNAAEEISCKTEIPNAELHINYQYLEDILKVINDDNIEISCSIVDGKILSAITVQGHNDNQNDTKHIIMPMQQ